MGDLRGNCQIRSLWHTGQLSDLEHLLKGTLDFQREQNALVNKFISDYCIRARKPPPQLDRPKSSLCVFSGEYLRALRLAVQLSSASVGHVVSSILLRLHAI